MKLRTRARYALRMMMEIARHKEPGQLTSLKQVAERTGISRRYLEQLVISLKHASLLSGYAGKSGGYQLARPASEIKIGQIIEAAIGPINIVDCVMHPRRCLKADVCECRTIYALINDRITEVLNEFSLDSMVDRKVLQEVYGRLSPVGSARGLPRSSGEKKNERRKKGEAKSDRAADR